MIRLLLVDDHEVVRLGLSSLLQAEKDLQVVAEAGSSAEALSILETTPIDVALIDIAMPGESGLVLLGHIIRDYPEIKTIVLSMHADEGYVVEALQLGAAGYVLKGEGAAAVVEAARTVMSGRRYLSQALMARAINGYVEAAGRRAAPRAESETVLTERETDVLRLLCSGVPKAQVASRLFISVRTVETHRANAMRKLGIHTQTELVRYAIRTGLVSAGGEEVAPRP